jgi:hypothetical protein
MRPIKRSGLALVAVFVFGLVLAAAAGATEPSGILYLPKQEGPVIVSGEGGPGTLTTIGLLKVSLKCEKIKFEGEHGKGEGTHSTLGTLTADYTGCALGANKCESENIAGEKDPEGTVLQVAEDTDGHSAALLNTSNELEAGILVGLLELVKETKKLDLTMNCSGVKALILGVLLFLAKPLAGHSFSEDVEEVEILPTGLPCDKEDKLCKTEQEKWQATALLFNPTTKKDELMVCENGLGVFIKTAEECANLTLEKEIKLKFSKDVLIDF